MATAEGLGTALLLSAIVGSGIMAERLAAGNVALALLANTIATATALVAVIVTFGPLSGAHFNPLVSGLCWLDGTLSTPDFAAYLVAQLAGAIGGVLAAHAMFDLPAVSLSHHARHGLNQGLAESIATTGLLLVIGLGGRTRPAHVPFTVAAYIAAAYWFTSSTSFANPVVTVARALTDTFAGIRPADVPTFLGGQIVGFVVSVGLLRWFRPLLSAESR